MHPAITEQLTVERIRDLKWRPGPPGYAQARRTTWRVIVDRAKRRRGNTRRRASGAVVLPFARREA